MADQTRKALNFDLDTANLKKYYPGKSYRSAYRDIKKFLCNHGFTHRQWSGYLSVDNMSDYEIKNTMLLMKITFPWLKKCVNRFDVTDIGEQHDLTHIITGKSKTNVKEKVQQQSAVKEKPIFTVAQLKKRAAEIQKQPHKEHTKNRSKDRDL